MQNTYLFTPEISESEVGSRVLGDVAARVFDGSTSAVRLKLFEVNDIDNEHLKELRRIINVKLKHP